MKRSVYVLLPAARFAESSVPGRQSPPDAGVWNWYDRTLVFFGLCLTAVALQSQLPLGEYLAIVAAMVVLGAGLIFGLLSDR